MSGSGKTTLARQLAVILIVCIYELDVIGYESGSGAKRSCEQRRADIQAITAQSAWVVEGSFLWWTEDLLKQADLIVWLDLPWWRCWWRIVFHHIKADLGRNNRHPGFRKMLRFAKGVQPYYTNPIPAVPTAPDDDGANRAAVAGVLTDYELKVVRCSRPSEVSRFVRQFKRGLCLRNHLAADISGT